VAITDEAARRGCHRIYLWTDELQNEDSLRVLGWIRHHGAERV